MPSMWDESPWIEGGLRLTKVALDALARDAIRGYLAGEEACGYLSGPASDPALCDEVTPLENLAGAMHQRDPDTFASPRTSFVFKERTLEVAMASGRARGRPVKVLYHSHLDVGAFLSGTDRAMFSRGGMGQAGLVMGGGPAWPLAFIVSSVRSVAGTPQVDDHRLYVWRAGDFHGSEFEVV